MVDDKNNAVDHPNVIQQESPQSSPWDTACSWAYWSWDQMTLTNFFVGTTVLSVAGSAVAYGVKVRKRNAFEALPTVLHMDFNAAIRTPARPENKLAALMGRPTAPLFTDLLYAIRKAAEDDRVTRVVARGGSSSSLSLAQVQELRTAIKDFKEATKGEKEFVVVAESIDSSLSYFLASAASKIVVQPGGDVCLNGFGVSNLFLKEALSKASIEPEFETRHEYKNATNVFTQTKYTGPHREAIVGLMDGFAEEIKEGVMADRKLNAEANSQGGASGVVLDDVMSKFSTTPKRALELGLIDELGFWSDTISPGSSSTVEGHDDALASVDKSTAYMNVKRFCAKHQRLEKKASAQAIKTNGAIAVIHFEGSIKSGRSNPRGGDIGADSVCSVLERAMKDSTIKAVVLRIDSPGGSAVASETIGRSIQRLQQAGKPVVASMGGVAASGGYWMSMYCQKIFALPTTITGSIGVIGGKFALGGMLKRLGITADEYASHDGMIANPMYNRWTEYQRQQVAQKVDDLYFEFVNNAAQCRGMDWEQVHAVAKGRVWTGSDALKAGLVDALGGLKESIAAARELLVEKGTIESAEAAEKLVPTIFPPPENPSVALLKRLSGEEEGASGAKGLPGCSSAPQGWSDLIMLEDAFGAPHDTGGARRSPSNAIHTLLSSQPGRAAADLILGSAAADRLELAADRSNGPDALVYCDVAGQAFAARP